MRITLLFIFSVFLLFANAQKTDTLRKIYDERTLYRYGSTFRIGNEKIRFGQLQGELKNSELGMVTYKKAKSYHTTSAILQLLSIGLTYFTINAIHDRDDIYLYLGLQLGLSVGSGFFRNLANQYTDKAIFLRNKDYLYPQ